MLNLLKTPEQLKAEREAAEKAANIRHGGLVLGNIALFLGYLFLALALLSYGILNGLATAAMIFLCVASHILIAQRAWEG